MRENWVTINVLYCLLLGAFIGWFATAIGAQGVLVTCILFAVLAFDWLTARQVTSTSDKLISRAFISHR